jgi:hypothetical protein
VRVDGSKQLVKQYRELATVAAKEVFFRGHSVAIYRYCGGPNNGFPKAGRSPLPPPWFQGPLNLTLVLRAARCSGVRMLVSDDAVSVRCCVTHIGCTRMVKQGRSCNVVGLADRGRHKERTWPVGAQISARQPTAATAPASRLGKRRIRRRLAHASRG